MRITSANDDIHLVKKSILDTPFEHGSHEIDEYDYQPQGDGVEVTCPSCGGGDVVRDQEAAQMWASDHTEAMDRVRDAHEGGRFYLQRHPERVREDYGQGDYDTGMAYLERHPERIREDWGHK